MNIKKILFCIIILSINSCAESIKNKFNAPNEFNIVKNPPLSVPPIQELNYDRRSIHDIDKNYSIKDKVTIDKSPSLGEKLLLEKIPLNNEDIKQVINKKKHISKKKSFFENIFTRKNHYSKDSTQDPEANETNRTYKSKSLQFMKTETNNNKKICNIQNGEVIYCDKNVFMKKFSFSAK